MPASGGLSNERPWVPQKLRGIQRILDEHADLVIGSDKLDAAIDAAIIGQITQKELIGLVWEIDRSITV